MSTNMRNTAPDQNTQTEAAAAEPTLDEAMLERRSSDIIRRLQELEQKVFGDRATVDAPATTTIYSGTLTAAQVAALTPAQQAEYAAAQQAAQHAAGQ